MPGAVEWNPDIIRAPTDYAMRRGDNWLAGPKAVEKGMADFEGQFISSSNRAVAVYKQRQTINQTKNIMREYEGEGTTEEEAREIREGINENLKEAENEDERREVWRSQMGYTNAAA